MSKTASGSNRVVVDWDGTCVELVYPAEGDWLPGAPEALHTFLREGLDVVIFSTRLAPYEFDEVTPLQEGQQEREYAYIRRLLDEEGLHDVQIWDKPWKPGAVAYIDDKAIRFDTWAKALEDMEPMLPQVERMI